jgi:predicted DNA-binding transcriptional regulator
MFGLARDRSKEMPQYQFLTNHAHVLLCVAHDPGIRLRDIAQTVGVTERSAHRIISELVEDGYVVRERIGRRNVYRVKPELPLRHPLTQETEQRRIGDLLEVLLEGDGRAPAGRQRQRTI